MLHRLPHLLFTLMLLVVSAAAVAQSIPQGMKYQAVARDPRGQVLANTSLQLDVKLYSNPAVREIAYSELHKITTNELGLFSLTIGEGLPRHGKFEQIPWADAEIWMQVSIQLEGYADMITISDSKMLSVPYAFHAGTAGALTGASDGSRGPGTSDPPFYWTIIGNKALKPEINKLGLLDNMDLIVITNDIERMRVLADGDIIIANSLNVGRDLAAGTNVELNVAGGETRNYGNLTVSGKTLLEDNLAVLGATYLHADVDVYGPVYQKNDTESFDPETGAVVVVGGVGIQGNLNVGGDVNFGGEVDFVGQVHILDDTQSESTSTGALVVDGGVGIGKRLNVGEATMLEASLTVGEEATVLGAMDVYGITTIQNTTNSNSKDDGALIVEGGVGIEGNLNIGGRLGMSSNTTGFVMSLENTNGSVGDGLEIRLGKTHPAWDGGAYLNVTNPGVEAFDGAVAQIEAWIDNPGSFQPSQLLNLWPNAYIAGFSCNLFNTITSSLNTALDLPLDLGPYHLFGPYQIWGGADLDPIPITIPPLVVPAITFPQISNLIPVLPQLNCGGMPSFSMPNLSLTDVDNSLDNENQFISFKDKDGRELGSIRAESVSDWRRRFFSGEYVVDVMAQIVGIDLLDCVVGAINKFTEMASSHNSIGVEYASGHGDYAEWLERADPGEWITEGDIVAVKGGKITKELAGAEQVMVVSTAPIMLGNQPEAGQETLGNKIAFLGQVPVKIMGPVAAGDFIVGQPETPGYGIAVSLTDMTPEQARYVVGRAWESKPADGPKRVNTVIGVDNGYFLQLLQRQQETVTGMDSRLAAIEARLNMSSDVSRPVQTAEATVSATFAKNMQGGPRARQTESK